MEWILVYIAGGLYFALTGAYSAYMGVFYGVITATHPRVRERNKELIAQMNKLIELMTLRGTPLTMIAAIVTAAFAINFTLRLAFWPIYAYRALTIRLERK